MKICQVGTASISVGPDVTGGAERYIHYLSKALSDRGHEVILIDLPRDDALQVPYRRLEIDSNVGWWDRRLAMHVIQSLRFSLLAARALRRLVDQEQVQVVNFHGQFASAFGIRAAKRSGIPSVFTMHNPLWSDDQACRSPLLRALFALEWRAEAAADHVVGLSCSVTQNRVRYFGLDPSRVSIVPVGVDDFWFRTPFPDKGGRSNHENRRSALVLQVGRISPYKNQLALLEALPPILRRGFDARLVFVGPTGSGDYLKKLRMRAWRAGLGDRVTFAGSVATTTLVSLYARADIVVLPSIRENCPQSLLEAMALGKAVVGSDIRPIKEILRDGAGRVVPLGSPETMASEICLLLEDGDLRASTGERARKRAHTEYRWSVVAKQIESAYQRASEKHRRVQ
jgi:glycosyltransferase involved in cell wall biosynthesis